MWRLFSQKKSMYIKEGQVHVHINVALSGVPATILAVKEQKVVHILSVCL